MRIQALSRSLLFLGIMTTLTGNSATVEACYSLPSSRSITWQGNVGIPSDIPNRTTIYTTISPSGGDQTSAIQTALNNCPPDQVVKLNAGTFNISSPLRIRSNTTLRGSGMGVTTIKGIAGTSGNHLIGIRNPSWYRGTSRNLTAGISKGSSSITSSVAHGWVSGDLVIVDQLNDATADPPVTNVGNNGTCTWCGRSGGNRSLGQLASIQTVPNSMTATLQVPLYWNYDPALSPQGTKINGVTTMAGIEDLTIDNSLSGSSAQDDSGTIRIEASSYCWLLRVEAIGSYEAMVRMRGTYRCVVRSCKFHLGIPATPPPGPQYTVSRSFGLCFYDYNSGNLVENNEFYHLTGAIRCSGPTSGNVIAYNYITDLYYNDSPYWQQFSIKPHGGHPMMNLWEGNYAEGRAGADNVWGSSSHNTFFRNRFYPNIERYQAVWDIDLQAHAQYYNIIGNVLGVSGLEDNYQLNNTEITNTTRAIYRFGYTSDGDKSASGNDAAVFTTVLRHGNWDYYNNGIVWNGSDNQTLPASFYLTGPPSWWGTAQWPAIGPDVSPMYPPPIGPGEGTPW